jgi:hypothetical protein
MSAVVTDSPTHQATADRLHEAANCWSWRRRLIADRIAELEDLELATERALRAHAGGNDIREAVLHVRELLARAEQMLQWEEPDYAELVCERAERELIALRGVARQVGAIQ